MIKSDRATSARASKPSHTGSQDYAIGQLIKSTNSQFLQSGFEDCQTQLAEIIETLEGIEGILALAEKLTPEELAEADEDFENMEALEKIC